MDQNSKSEAFAHLAMWYSRAITDGHKMRSGVQKTGVIISKLEHTAAHLRPMWCFLLSPNYFQKNLFKLVSAETVVSGCNKQKTCTNNKIKVSFSAWWASIETLPHSQTVDMTPGLMIRVSNVYQLKTDNWQESIEQLFLIFTSYSTLPQKKWKKADYSDVLFCSSNSTNPKDIQSTMT